MPHRSSASPARVPAIACCDNPAAHRTRPESQSPACPGCSWRQAVGNRPLRFDGNPAAVNCACNSAELLFVISQLCKFQYLLRRASASAVRRCSHPPASPPGWCAAVCRPFAAANVHVAHVNANSCQNIAAQPWSPCSENSWASSVRPLRPAIPTSALFVKIIEVKPIAQDFPNGANRIRGRMSVGFVTCLVPSHPSCRRRLPMLNRKGVP